MPNKFVNYKNRGMFLEHIINDSNTYYLSKDIAVIYKKPTPIKVLNVSYRSKKTKLFLVKQVHLTIMEYTKLSI